MASRLSERGAPGGSATGTSLGKRKKVRLRHSDFLHSWLEKAAHQALTPQTSNIDTCPPPPPPPSYLPLQLPLYPQRLFTTASDPSVCRYSNPYAYPAEPLSLPICAPPYYPIQHPLPADFQIPPKNTRRLNCHKKSRASRKHVENDLLKLPNGSGEARSNTPSLASGINNDFASLPPVVKEDNVVLNGNDESKSEKRRFSDPGFAQNETFEGNQDESGDESESETSSMLYEYNANSRLIMCLVDHINTLKDNNKRLHKELHDSKGELESLKQQLSIWRGDSSSTSGQNGHNVANSQPGGLTGSTAMYAPGMLADLVREIRDASKVREEAIFSKVRSLIDDKNYNNKNNCAVSQEKCYQDWRSYEQMKNQHQTTLADKARTNDRLFKLEEELYNLRINSSRDSISPCSSPGFAVTNVGNLPSTTDQDRIRIQMELNKERTARAAADARAHKLELLVTQMRSKRGGSGGYAPATPTHTPSYNGLSPDPRQMVLGPITDL
ncbi:uncharacterized protein LOC143918830 [Arctopsyche grandis]|uniref:uncharacterized protein LOC143918830 n=1 Tax=Arctopsyche grandis TaxID=121162 RepID=UPI00406D9942